MPRCRMLRSECRRSLCKVPGIASILGIAALSPRSLDLVPAIEAPPDTMSRVTAPLEGLRVLELGQLIAAPFSTMHLGYFGADVIKVEPPDGGDPLRTWRHVHDGTSLWWYILGRNKKSITADLRQPAGRDLVRQLIARSDV